METEEARGRVYVDTCIRPSSTDDALEIIGVLASLGYRAVIVERDEMIDPTKVEKRARELGLLIAWRRTGRASGRKSARRHAEAARGDVVAVIPLTQEAARYAAQSRSIHIIVAEPGLERLVDRSTLTLFRQRGWGLVEIPLSYVLDAARESEHRLEVVLRHVFTAFRRAAGYGVPLGIASCAENRWGVFHPFHIVGLASLAGVPEEVSLRWLSEYPLRLLAASRYS